ncbi:two-component response regulator ORR23-like [Momordica charantia]|uniref:Two-component response regulator ORR23-like n=1 Tax=Momordica charantia TaxID=3673 RepID=A0A6J1DNA3_MOMCH|nr:two-component response regulator ORR23-like [Momordica charantia]
MSCHHQQVAANNILLTAPPVRIHVMLVDDDATSLAVVSGLLKTLNYEVTPFNDPICALYTLRTGKQIFDLVITDLYMPNMDGFELTRRVNDEFKLPVIMISIDDRESIMLKAIQEGVVLYLLKPFTINDLRNIWQFALSTKSRSKPNPNLFIEETGSHGPRFPAFKSRSEEVNSVSSSNERRRGKKKKDSKGKGKNQEKANDKKELTTTTKKAKVVWTDFLQYRFLQAVHYIGLDRAVPKKILEIMNVPGLTRENVASHLQKYRIFLRKVAERCMVTSDKTIEEVLWSKFLSRHATLVLEKIQKKRTRHLNSAQNPNIPPLLGNLNSNDNYDDHQSRYRPTSYPTNLLPFNLDHIRSFIGGNKALQRNPNKAQSVNFEDRSYPSLPSFLNNDNYTGFSVRASGELQVAQKGVSMGFEDYSREYGQNGIGFGGDHESYNWGLMSNYGVNFGENSQTVKHYSSHSLDNKDGGQEDSGFLAPLFPMQSFVDNINPTPNYQQQGNGSFMVDESHHAYNIYTADEETSTTDPFSIDEKVLDEFMASLLRNDTSTEG